MKCVWFKVETLKGQTHCALTQQPSLGAAGRLPEVGVDGDGACLKKKKIDGKKKIQHQKQFKSNVKPHTKVSSLKSHITGAKDVLGLDYNYYYLLPPQRSNYSSLSILTLKKVSVSWSVTTQPSLNA